MHTLISGGCKNGKSYYAQRIAQAIHIETGAPLYYVATMISTGAEDDLRIERHIRDRAGWGFETIECGKNLLNVFDAAAEDGVFLLDIATALLANEMFSADGIDYDAPERVANDLEKFLRRCRAAVVVSDFIYSDAGIFDEWTECYRRGLARVDRCAAEACENVLEVSSGQVVCHKGVKRL